jgi:hypothetical protein
MDDESEQCKDVYAHFGLAFYEACTFETGLAIALMHVDFCTKKASEIKAKGRATFDRRIFEAQFDAFMADQHNQTLGNLVKRLQKISVLDEKIRDRISEAKKLRDFLSHHYFRERAVDFMQSKGREKMIAELWEWADVFRQLDRDVHEAIRPLREAIGIRDEWLEKKTWEMIDEMLGERVPKKTS